MKDPKVVVRFNDGKTLKGYLKDFSVSSSIVKLREAKNKKEHTIPAEKLKALFFVKTFEGDREYRDRKAYGIGKSIGRKVFVRFKDGESMVGFVEGEFPWKKGFFLSKADTGDKGFFLIPVDSGGNNTKVFVMGSAVQDVTVMP
ncbi:MAG: hypothetical protein AB1390_02450 [Nitrospirota bacterium]